MGQLETTTLRQKRAGVIEVELCSFAPSRSITSYTNGPRAILGLSLPPYPQRRKACYHDLGPAFHDLGNLILTPPRTDCQFSGDSNRSFAFRCYFDDGTFRHVTGISDVWSEGLLMKTFDIGGNIGVRIDFLLRQMIAETQTPGFASETLLEGLGLTALAQLARYLHGKDSEYSTISGHLSLGQLRRLEHLLDEFTGGAPTISDLARECEIGPRRFTTLFKATTGQTVKEWVDRRRMDKARKLLVETNIPLKVIAFDLGFANQSLFSTAFRLRAGISPSEYRKAFR